jgi:hypothetical protein
MPPEVITGILSKLGIQTLLRLYICVKTMAFFDRQQCLHQDPHEQFDQNQHKQRPFRLR